MKTYNFKEFMKGQHEVPKRREVKAYSSLLPLGVGYVVKTMFFNEGVLLVSIVGGIAIIYGIVENRLAKKGDSVNADRVAIAGLFTLKLIGYGAVFYFLGHLYSLFGVGL
jgi:hypothetical protein